MKTGLSVSNRGYYSSSGPVYVRTAFVNESIGNDGTAQLNNPLLPYETIDAAVVDLASIVGVLTSTIVLQSNVASGIAANADWLTLLSNGVTIKSDSTQRTLSGTVTLGGGTHDSPNVLLTLENIIISLIEELNTQTDLRSLGTITGDANSIIDSLTISGATPGSPASNGLPGGTQTGSSGSGGGAGDPPEDGGDGQSVSCDGTSGGNGGAGCSAFSIALVGPGTGAFTVNVLEAKGLNGGIGGDGGNGGSAVGGNGGSGGNALGTDQDGGNGGDGGSASAMGGEGGTGGNGGDGGAISVTGNVTISNPDFSEGIGGLGGSGGSAGSATGGSGGAGGAGSGAGNTGFTGFDGSASAFAGSSGMNGNDGNAGGIL